MYRLFYRLKYNVIMMYLNFWRYLKIIFNCELYNINIELLDWNEV